MVGASPKKEGNVRNCASLWGNRKFDGFSQKCGVYEFANTRAKRSEVLSDTS